MTAELIDGKKIAQQMQAEIALEVADFTKRTGVIPCLYIVMVGDDPRSRTYVQRKMKALESVGMRHQFWHWLSWDEHGHGMLVDDIRHYCSLKWCHGMLVQLPLPPEYDPFPIFDAIAPEKDVDVFNPVNVGLLLQGRPRLKPCTPAGIVEMLKRSGINLPGKKVAVINRSNVVGKPLSSMLIQDCNEYANATVTICHNKTPPDLLKAITLSADIVVVAVGIAGFLTADMVRPGQVIVDVGTNHLPDTNKLVGDVDFGPVSEIVAAISPVPGGVGPMTVTMLLRNTLEAAKMQVQ